MSIYCTLPRRHQFSGINNRRNTVVSAEEARKLVDELFNPIVEYDCDDTNDQNSNQSHTPLPPEDSAYDYNSNSSVDSNNFQNNLSSIYGNYWPMASNRESDQRITQSAVNTSNSDSKSCNDMNDKNQNQNSSTKLYYAFDNFDDFRRRRKSLAPDFYGGGMTSSFYGNDSAYESLSPSYESLKSDSGPQKFKKKSKYFTLPNRRSSGKTNRLKDNVHEIAKSIANNNNINTNNNNINNYKNALSSLSNKLESTHNSNANCVPKSGFSNKEFHCCCRSGCHSNTSNRNTYSNSNPGLHCCQQMLETLWEEPIVEATALIRNASRRPLSAVTVSHNNSGTGSSNKIQVY